ncbi:MAG: helix-turn-helix transcriptional regulator [Actinomycetota bacterium]|nr:helix-turn-helix transcriptional regulator [Actinomycetota bacterium]
MLERFWEWRRRRALAREQRWAERPERDLSDLWPPLTVDSYLEIVQEGNRRRRAEKARERLNMEGNPPHTKHPREEYDEALVLKAALARMDEPRSVAARLNLLFEHVTDQYGEPFANETVAERSRGRLTAEKVEQLRNRSADRITSEDLLAISDAFCIDYHEYWASVKAPLEELDPEVAEQRRLRRDYPNVTGYDVLKNDLHAYMAEQGLTYEDVAEEAGNVVHPRHLEAVLDGRTVLRVEQWKALAETMGEAKGLSAPAWRERYLCRGLLGDLVP